MGIPAYIKDLLDGKKVASSRLPQNLIEKYLSEGLISISARGSQKSVRVLNHTAFQQYLIDNNESYRILKTDSITSRASMAAETGNSKLFTVRSCPGFPVNSLEPIECRLNSNQITINPPKGTFTFVWDWRHFEIPEDVTVVGIENMENFRMVELQKSLFIHTIGNSKILFVSRYPQSLDLRKWLQSIPNRYIHFGDFDLAGIRIYLTEFESYLRPRASFLIPPDIESRIKYGSSQRYDDQYKFIGDITSTDVDIQKLINIINRERKGYDQEGYLEKQFNL